MNEISDSERAGFERVKAGLKQANITPNQSRQLFEDLESGLLGGNLAFVHNMGLLAVQSNLNEKAYAIGMDMMENGYPSSALAIAARGLSSTPQDEASVFYKMLTAAAQLGHIRARSFLWGHNLKKFGPLRYLVLLPIRLGIAAHGFAIAIKDPNDIRVDMGTTTKPPFRKR